MRYVGSILILCAIACGPSPDKSDPFQGFVDGSPGSGADAASSAPSDAGLRFPPDASARSTYQLDPLSTQDLTAHGGGGGSAFSLPCPSGMVAVGLFGRSGSELDQIGLSCAPLAEDGTLGEVTKTESRGGGGGDPFDHLCPTQEILVGLSGRSGDRVDQVRGACATLAGWLDTAQASDLLPPQGGGGGSPFDVACPAGMVINELKGRSGARVDQIQPSCIGVVQN